MTEATHTIKDRTALMIHFRNPKAWTVQPDGWIHWHWSTTGVDDFMAAQMQAETGEDWDR